MAVHNGLPYLLEAVESILAQSFKDFEFILIDDASQDGSTVYLEGLGDERIRLLKNKQHLGLTRSLNIGLEAAQGEYIARMDHDDVSLPGRLGAQAAFLDAHPHVDLCGTWAQTIGGQTSQIWRYPLHDADIKSEMLFASVLVHSSVMLRRKSLDKHDLRYDPQIERAQDYELWARAAPYLNFANLGEVLLRYRIHPGQVGRQHGKAQQKVADEVRLRQLQRLNLEPSSAERSLHNALARWEFAPDRRALDDSGAWLHKLVEANRRVKVFTPESLSRTLEKRWWAACRAAVGLGLDAWTAYKTPSLDQNAHRPLHQQAGFFLKCLLREAGLR